VKNYKIFDIQVHHLIFQKYVNDMISIFAKAPEADELITYCGIKHNYLEGHKKGDIFQNSTFMSTSLF